MKHLKRFEQLSNIEHDMHWIVDTTNRFDVVMFKLNMPQKNIDIFNSVLKSIKADMIYIFYNKSVDWFTWG